MIKNTYKCDKTICKVEAEEGKTHGWLKLSWLSGSDEREWQFCSWDCASEFAYCNGGPDRCK